MLNDFSFSYGQSEVRCFARSHGPSKRWYFQVDAGPELPGPPWSPTDTTSSVSSTVRRLYRSVRDSGEPVAGKALYALAPNVVNMEPHPSQHAWLRPGECFEGRPDESTRTPDRVDILLYNPAEPDQPPARVESQNVQRVEPEDCE